MLAKCTANVIDCDSVHNIVQSVMDEIKDVWWEGSSLDDLKQFPEDVKLAMGYQLHRVQSGEMPNDWKPLKNICKDITGVYEIRVSLDKNILRTAYVANV